MKTPSFCSRTLGFAALVLSSALLAEPNDIPDIFNDPTVPTDEVASTLDSQGVLDVVTSLKNEIKQKVEDRIRELKNSQNQLGLDEFKKSLENGHFRFEKAGVGYAKVSMVDGDMAFKIELDPQIYSHLKTTTFLILDLPSLQPDQNKIADWIRQFSLDMSENVNSDAPEEWVRFIEAVAEKHDLTPEEITRDLQVSSPHLKKYLSRLLLEKNVTALGFENDQMVWSENFKKPKLFSKDFFRNWWTAKKGAVTKGSILVGLVCGTIQGMATFYMTNISMGHLIAQGDMGQVGTVFPVDLVPHVAAAWSFTYGLTLGAINSFYRNVVYSGSTTARIMKLSFFGAVFGYVSKAITNPWQIASFDGEWHIWSNILINQWLKDDAYRVPRYREEMGFSRSNYEINLPKVPQFLKKIFPRLFNRVPEKIQIRTSDVDTQLWYHKLWFLKFAEFEKLVPKWVLFSSVAYFRTVSYGYFLAHYLRLQRQLKRNHTPETERELEVTRKYLHDLNHSWVEFVSIPWQGMKSVMGKLKSMFVKNKSTTGELSSCELEFQSPSK